MSGRRRELSNYFVKLKTALSTHPLTFLHVAQFSYEVENYRTPKRNEVRQGSSEETFPGFSGLGYAIFNELQPKVIIDVDIKKNSMHQIVLRYVNPTDSPKEMVFTLTPGSDELPSKQFRAKLPPAKEPTFIRLPAFQQFEGQMLPGPWTIQMESSDVLVDYLVTLPHEYISAAALRENIKRPCRLGEDRPCNKMTYPPLERAVEVRRISNWKFCRAPFGRGGRRMRLRI